MVLEVQFNVKKYRNSWSDQLINFTFENIKAKIEIKNEDCHCTFSGENPQIWDVFYATWELLALYDGYFYTPIRSAIDGTDFDIKELYGIKFRKTDPFWRDGATLLGQGERLLDENVLSEYMKFRNQDRQQGKMVKSLVNAYFYLLSEAYKEVNIEHKLSLMLNICDGYYLNEIGDGKNNSAHIMKLVENIGQNKFRHGLELMGIPKNQNFDLLGNVRNEIDHYFVKPNSAGSYMPKIRKEASEILNLYLLYVAELSVRVTMLERVHGYIVPQARKRAMDSINDWMILKCNFSEKCELPENQMKQAKQALINASV